LGVPGAVAVAHSGLKLNVNEMLVCPLNDTPDVFAVVLNTVTPGAKIDMPTYSPTVIGAGVW
jgi:hypothetical protein